MNTMHRIRRSFAAAVVTLGAVAGLSTTALLTSHGSGGPALSPTCGGAGCTKGGQVTLAIQFPQNPGTPQG